jgi:hypothetical protein
MPPPPMIAPLAAPPPDRSPEGPRHAKPPPAPVTPPEGMHPADRSVGRSHARDPVIEALAAQLDLLEAEVAALRDQLTRLLRQHPH